MKKLLNWLKSPKSDFALLIILLILVNLVGHSAFLRFDLTSPKSYSLSKGSKTLVKNLQEPLSVSVFFDDNLPSPYNSVSQYVKDMLQEYKGAANKNFTVNYMDMNSQEGQGLASDYGLSQIQIQEVKNNEVGFKQVYMGLVLSYGDAIETIDTITSSDGFEYKFTSKVSKMINTADTLAGLGKDEKINLTLYYSNTLKNMGISGYAETEDYVKKAVKEVNKQCMDRVDFTVVDAPSAQALELINTYGLQGISFVDKSGEKQTAAIGLLLQYGENFRTLSVSVQQSLFGYVMGGLDTLQTDITEGIQGLLSNVTKIGYVVGHGELDLNDEQNACANLNKLVSEMYEFVSLDLSEDNIPAGMTSIIINGPQNDFTEEELYKIDQFVMRGGNVMFFVDSMVKKGEVNYFGNQSYLANESNLDRLLNKWGVQRGYNIVMDKNCYESQNQQYGKLNLYWVPVLQKGQMPKKHPVTANLGYVYFLQSGSLDVSAALENKDISTTVLAKSSDQAWTQSENIMFNPMMITVPEESEFNQFNLAVLMEGKFVSSFDAAPVVQKTDDNGKPVESAAGNLETSNFLSAAVRPGKVFVASSSYITSGQVIDETGSTPIAMFMLNLIDYMNGNTELCTMRTKGLQVNTLNLRSMIAVNFWKIFNEWGLVILLACAGFIVWKMRNKRRKAINKLYNPNDTRTVEKGEKDD